MAYLLKLRLPILFLALACLASFILPGTSSAEPKTDRTVILISVDGLAHYYFDDPKAQIPTIRQLAAEGARAKTMECSFPTVTWPNHTTLVTGVTPGKHGVIGNNYFDRETLKTVPFIPDPLFDKVEIVTSPTIYDVAHEAGLKTAGVIWPASRRAPTLDWQVPDVFDQETWEDASTPSLLEELKAKGIPYERQMEWCKAGTQGKAMRDWMYGSIASHVLATHKPNVLLLHLVSVDAMEHATGRQSPEAYWACNDSDQRIRQVVEAVEAAGMRDRTTFFICADHGFITYTKQIAANNVLREMGLRSGQGLKLEQQAYVLGQGGGAFVYILDEANRDEIAQKLAEKFKTVEGVEAVIERKDFAAMGHRDPTDDPREPDLMLSAADGYSFSGSDDGKEVISETDGPKGSHGYLHTHPLMGATCVISGAGVKKGVVLEKVSNLDVAPTMAALLGLEMPSAEGRVLEEILTGE